MLEAEVQKNRRGERIGKILFEFGTINLLDELSSKKLKETEILSILLEICLALEEIHAAGVCHLDMKP